MVGVLSLLVWAQTQPGGVTFIEIGNQEPEHDLIWVILSTFALIGLSLLIMMALGAGLGVFRIWIFKHFPGNKLNGPEYEVMTRLHLHDRTSTGETLSK